MTTFSDMVAARTIYGEARGELDDGKRAVAHVIRNRAANPTRYGATPAGVCLAKMQFSCWNPDDPNRRLLIDVSDEDSVLQTCLRAWLDSEKESDPTGGSTHYLVTGTYVRWAEGVAPFVAIGRHSFYRGIL